MSDPAAQQDLQIHLARLEHAVGRVADETVEADAQVAAAEQAAQSATDVGAAFDRLVREAAAR